MKLHDNPLISAYKYPLKVSMQEADSRTDLLSPNFICSNAEKATQLCCQKSCQNNPIVCSNPICECRNELHENCYFGNLACLTKRFQSKRKDMTIIMDENILKMHEEMIMIYDEMIEQISGERERLKEWREYYGLNENQSDLYRKMLGNRVQESNGLQIYSAFESLKKDELAPFMINKSKVKQQFAKSKRCLNAMLKSLRDTFIPYTAQKENIIASKGKPVKQPKATGPSLYSPLYNNRQNNSMFQHPLPVLLPPITKQAQFNLYS